MKKILFKSGSTMMGGLEKVQIEYINFLLEQEKYQVKIVIENDNGRDNALEKYINSKIIYLKDFNYILKIRKLREIRKKSLWSRIKYNFAILKEKKYADEKFLKIYKEYKPDIVIDFDSSLTKIIDKLDLSKNLVWIHSSIENWKKKKSKINRFVDRISKYDKIVCICREMKEDLIKLKSSLRNKVDFLYNPIDFDKIKKLSEEDFYEEDKNFKKRLNDLINLGLNEFRKNDMEEFNDNVLITHKEYKRIELQILLDSKVPKGTWRAGYANTEKDICLFITNDKSHIMQENLKYDNSLHSDKIIQWISQPKTYHSSSVGQMFIRHREKKMKVHVFARKYAFMNGNKTNPFIYLGQADYHKSFDDKPMTILWKLHRKLPQELIQELYKL